MSTTPETISPDTLSVDIVERNLSDRSKVFSVAIRECGAMPFVELDAIDEKSALLLRQSILVAISNFTNIPLRP